MNKHDELGGMEYASRQRVMDETFDEKGSEQAMKACCREYLSKQFPGDDGVVEEIYAEYCSAMGEKLTEMTQTLAKADWEVLDRLAHTVKGNSLWVGDTEMAEVAIELRGAAKTSDTAKAESCIARLREIAAGL